MHLVLDVSDFFSASGELFSWGCGRGGKLGHGDIQDRFTPLKVRAFSKEKVICISCHELHSAAVTGKYFDTFIDLGPVYTTPVRYGTGVISIVF